MDYRTDRTDRAGRQTPAAPDPDGMPPEMKSLLDAARAAGINAKVLKLDADNLPDDLPPDIIAALRAMTGGGPAAPSMVPELLAAMTDPDVRVVLAKCLPAGTVSAAAEGGKVFTLRVDPKTLTAVEKYRKPDGKTGRRNLTCLPLVIVRLAEYEKFRRDYPQPKE